MDPFRLRNLLRAATACIFPTSQPPKVVRTWCAFRILLSKCSSYHNAVHFFDTSTSKSDPRLSVFNTFHFQMCFSPQRRALFNISTSKCAPSMRCFVRFDFEMCFAPQRRALFNISTSKSAPTIACQQPLAIFDLSSDQMAPHPPL